MSQPPPLDPYRPPQAPPPLPVHTAAAGRLFMREGKVLLVRDGAQLPPYCVKTDEPVPDPSGRQAKNLSWSPSWVMVLLLLSFFGSIVKGPGALLMVLVLAILALLLRKRLRLGYSVGRPAGKKLNGLRALAALGVVMGFGVIAVVIYRGMNHPTSPIIAMGGGMLTIVCLALLTQVAAIRVAGWRKGWFRVKGCGPAFLDRIERGG